MTISEVFEAHGIHLDERQAIELIDNALSVVQADRATATPVSPAEAAIYDAADFGADPQALARLSADAAGEFIALLASALPVAEAADRLGVTRARMQQMVSARDVWAIRSGPRWVLPAIQFDGNTLLAGWGAVVKSIPDRMHPLEILGFLTTPQPELELGDQPRTVIEWLRTGGDPSAAAALASGLGGIGL